MQDKFKIDHHKLNYHPERLASWIKGENIYPIYVEIGPTSSCNHRCIFCAFDYTGYKGSNIDRKVLLDAITDMAKGGVKSVMFSGDGEPTLHKDFALFVQHAKKNGIDVALTTNGSMFSKKLAELCLPYFSWVKFSVDAATPETHSRIHGAKPVDFLRIMSNIKDSVELRKKHKYPVTIGIQALLIKDNSHEILKLAKEAKEIGVDYIVVKPYARHPKSLKKFDLDYDEFSSLQKPLEAIATDKFQVVFRLQTIKRLKETKPYNSCLGLPFFAIIDADGNVVPCHLYHGNKDYYYGNLYSNSFSEIWNSERRMKIVEKIYKQGVSRCRENCRLEAINRYLYDLKNPPEHVNFV